jgi:hypothetical protein
VSQGRIPPDRFHFAWLIVWTVWGGIVGLLVYSLDRERTIGLNWLSAGIFIGSCGIQILRPLATPLHEWYERRAGGERYLNQMIEVMMEAHAEGLSEEELRERLEKYQQSREFQQYLENSLYGVTLAVSPLFGLFYGTLAGGVLGALCPISPELHLTSARGAFWGVVIGPLFVSFLASATCAVMHPSPKFSSRSIDLSRRLALLTAPVLIVPAVFHCLKKVAQ